MGGDVGDPFEGLQEHYVQTGALSQDEAAVYAIALQRGRATVSIAQAVRTSLEARAARKILRSLTQKGFLKERNPPHPEHKGGSGRSLVYVPVAPSIMVSKELQRVQDLRPQIDLIDEHLEHLSEGASIDEGVYFTENHAVGIQELCDVIEHSKKEVIIAGRDCDEFGKPALLGSMVIAIGNGVAVRMVVSANNDVVERFKKNNLVVKNCPVALPPFTIIDSALMVVAFKPNIGSPRYAFMTSRNGYLIKRYKALFDFFFRSIALG